MCALAAFCLPLILFQSFRVVSSPISVVPIYAISALFFVVAYAFSRTRHTTVAGLYAALASSVIPYGGVGSVLVGTSVYEEVMWMVLAVFIASLALPLVPLLAWGAANVSILGLLFLRNPEIPSEAALTVIAFLSLVTCLSGIWSSIRASDSRTIEQNTAELTRTSNHLRREMEFATKTIEAMGDALLVVDNLGNLLLVNGSLCELLGFERERLSGLPAAMLFSNPDHIEEIYSRIHPEGSTDSDLIEAKSTHLVTSDGEQIPMTLNVAAIRADNQRLLGVVCVARDMRPAARLAAVEQEELSQRKRSEELEASNQRLVQMQAQHIHAGKLAAVGQLASAFAHEISVPLDEIQHTANRLEKRTHDAQASSNIAEILASRDRAQTIVDRLLTFGRERGRIQEPVDLSEIVQSSLELVGHKIRMTGARLSSDSQRGRYMVLGDPAQLQQLVLNLLLNAGQAVDDSGAISVKLEIVDTLVQLVVADDGIGMSREAQTRIFEPFFTTDDFGDGPGLGLSTAYGIARGHGGSISVNSQPGEGASFTVRMTWRPEQAKPVVLIVDDNSLVLPALTTAVTRAGSEAFSASNSVDAMSILAKHSVDIVLSDLDLGREDGVEFLDAVHKAYPKTMTLLISGSTLSDIPDHVFDFLPKPVSFRDLKFAIANAMTERRQRTAPPSVAARV
jgi:PAS domain S-box-containing protein